MFQIAVSASNAEGSDRQVEDREFCRNNRERLAAKHAGKKPMELSTLVKSGGDTHGDSTLILHRDGSRDGR